MVGRFAVVVFLAFGLVAVGCSSGDDNADDGDASTASLDASSDGNALSRDGSSSSDATLDSGHDVDATVGDGSMPTDATTFVDASDLDASDAGDSSDGGDLCSGFVADASCFLPGVCAAGNAASSCHNGVIVPCVTGSPSGVSETICNNVDDNCNGSTDELASPTACPKVVNVVVVYDAEAAALVSDLPDLVSTSLDNAAARFTAANFSPEVSLNLGAQINWSVLVPSDFTQSTGDPVDPSALLTNFTSWVTAHKTAIDTMTGSPADYVILVTGHSLTSGVLLGWENAMCTTYDTSLISATAFAYDPPATKIDHLGYLIANMIGTNIGLTRDSASSGFVMSPTYAANAPFSATSVANMHTYFTTTYTTRPLCLEDAPTIAWESEHCGDGRKGPHEACDPGVDIPDSCCTPTCSLGASCACANTEGCCNAGAIVSAASNTTCRAATGTCDVADVCDGVSSDCPFDKVQAPGPACTTGGLAGACYEGHCISGQEELNAITGVTTDTFCYALTSGNCQNLEFDTTGDTSCSTFYTNQVLDGRVCGASEQCLNGTCSASSGLAMYAWTTSPWSVCSSGYQTRTVACVDETGASASAALCPTQPVTLRGCP